MPVLTRDALEASPLADLHAIAGEIGLDGFRRLRKADLIDAILESRGESDGGESDNGDEKPARRSRGSRGGRGRRASAGSDETSEDEESDDETAEEKPKRARRKPAAKDEDGATDEGADDEDDGDEGGRGGRSRRGSRGGRGRGGEKKAQSDEDEVVRGTVEILGNGSGFLRLDPPEPSDDDVYISAAQVRRCELVDGDEVAGPRRAPRRSERYPSLVRIDTINGRPADEVAEGTPFDELPCAFPTERFALGGEDATLKAVEWLTPIGRGSRVVITGAARSGKSESLRRLATALAAQEELEVSLVLAGVRPEELASGGEDAPEPVAKLAFSASAEQRGQAIERAVDTARRLAARGGHAVVLIDTLDGIDEHTARRVMGSARAIVDGGSLTVIATASEPVGGETTVIALDQTLTSTGRFPALDLVASGTLKPELLVGEAGAEAIASARASALG